ncbi:LacI family DNA-binding transcriptional regulator [Mycoplasma simbae]|uniref:LacI family DNA-binding transcriptional regulator n=1 Tax=Mycoplasma simbae TaxID=36744 RepID=UPI0004982CA5|nr:LacI family DNA-binding transcriptional regulator [Mycoplasma simbae]
MRSFSYKDISTLAKVSISTVSRFYNGGYVSKKTRSRIEKVVREHGYYPNNGARLIKGRSNSIFAIVPDVFDSSYGHIISGIEGSANDRNKKVFITHSSIEQHKYIETIRYCLAWKPNALVLFLPKRENDMILNFLKDHPIDSTLVVYGEPVEGINWIDVDVKNAFYSVTRSFHDYIEENQKIIYADDVKLSERQKELRFEGFKTACEYLGIEYERYSIDNRKNQDVQKFQKYLIDNKHVNVVCSTHESFVNLVSSNDNQLRLTDIGTHSIYDTQKKYKAKIFIDYHKIGENIERAIHDTDIQKLDETKKEFDTIKTEFRPMIITQK